MDKVLIQLVKDPKITKRVSKRDARILIQLGRFRYPPESIVKPRAAVITAPQDEYSALSYGELRTLAKERELEPVSFQKADLLTALRAPYLNRAMTSE